MKYAFKDTDCSDCNISILDGELVYYDENGNVLCPKCAIKNKYMCPQCNERKKPNFKVCFECGKKGSGGNTAPAKLI